jgi:hypothetical protein
MIVCGGRVSDVVVDSEFIRVLWLSINDKLAEVDSAGVSRLRKTRASLNATLYFGRVSESGDKGTECVMVEEVAVGAWKEGP